MQGVCIVLLGEPLTRICLASAAETSAGYEVISQSVSVRSKCCIVRMV